MSQFIPENDGEYKLSFTPIEFRDNPVGGDYRLLVLDASPGAPGIIEVVEEELSVGQIDEISFDGRAGERLVAVIQSASSDSVGTIDAFEPRMELLDPADMTLGFVFAAYGLPEAELLELPQDGIYKVLLSQTGLDTGRYRLVIYMSS